MNLTFIVGFRNLDTGRVIRSLDSLTKQSCQEFEMIFLDYGSTTKVSSSIQELLKNYPFCTYYYSDTRGWLWNRSAALNTGARLAKSKYLFFTDIDIIYGENFVEETLKQMNDSVFLISDTLRVPQTFTDWSKITSGKYDHQFKSMKGRGIACYARQAFEEIGGLDEQFVYWGEEDNDIARRMVLKGLREIFPERLVSYHQYHPRTSTEIPYSLLFHNTAHYRMNKLNHTVLANQDYPWGMLISEHDRPVFHYVDPESNRILNTNALHFFDAYDMSGIIRWVKEVEGTDQAAWAMSRNRRNNRFSNLMNKILRRAGGKLDYSITLLDEFAQGLQFAVPGFFQDYFLDCIADSGKRYSIFITQTGSSSSKHM